MVVERRSGVNKRLVAGSGTVVVVVVGPQLFISWFGAERSNLQHLQREKPLLGRVGGGGVLVSGEGWG